MHAQILESFVSDNVLSFLDFIIVFKAFVILFMFLIYEGIVDPNTCTTKRGPSWAASETSFIPFKLHFSGQTLNAGLVDCDISGDPDQYCYGTL